MCKISTKDAQRTDKNRIANHIWNENSQRLAFLEPEPVLIDCGEKTDVTGVKK